MEKDMQQENAIMLTDSTNSLQDMERSIEQTDRFIQIMDKIRMKCVRLTNINDWIDQNDVPYLEASGCDKIAKCFGIQVYEITCEKDHFTDDKGEYYQFTTSGSGSWLNNVTHEIGVASTRDKFFAVRKVDGESVILPLSEIDIGHVKKKSHTNFMNRLVKKLLGLHYTWSEIEEMSGGKVTKLACTRFKYDKGKSGGKKTDPKTTERRSECRKMILELCGGDAAAAKKMLASMTAWTPKTGANAGKQLPGKTRVEDCSDSQIDKVIYPNVKKQYNELMKQRETAEIEVPVVEDDGSLPFEEGK